MICLQFVENLRKRLLAQGVLTEAERDDVIDALKYHLEDPDTLVASRLFFQVSGAQARAAVQNLPDAMLQSFATPQT
jgi:hypothetical protein